MAFPRVLPRSSIVAILFVALHGRAFAGEGTERPELESNASVWEVASGHEALPELASNASAVEAAHDGAAPAGLGEALASGGAGQAEPLVSLAASSLRGSLRGTRCICSTTDPAVLTCAARLTDGLDCFWGCEKACAKKGWKVKQCATAIELLGVTGC